MKKMGLILLGVVLGLAGAVNAAVDWDIYQNTNITGGDYGKVTVNDSVILNISGSNTSIFELYTNDTCNVNISDGNIISLVAESTSRVNLRGGNTSNIRGGGTDAIHIYGYDFIFTRYDENNPFRGVLTGFWGNGQELTIHFRDCPPRYEGETPIYTNSAVLHIVPEPTSVLIMLAGVFIKKFTR